MQVTWSVSVQVQNEDITLSLNAQKHAKTKQDDKVQDSTLLSSSMMANFGLKKSLHYALYICVSVNVPQRMSLAWPDMRQSPLTC